jgi:hypothetical protein
MATLAVVYVVILYSMSRGYSGEDSWGTTCFFFGAFLTVPLLIRGRRAFAIVCWSWAIWLLFVGVVMAMGGWFVFWPAVLPLLLAQIRTSDRATPVVLSLTTALLALAAYFFAPPLG